jgi:2-polyprenyl-6-methoxyphenol hydroxylase-like FAD-dependent oxidoreductase
MFTRPFLEDAIRHRVAAVPNVRIRSGVGVDGLLAPDGQVKGVVIGKEGKGGESTLDADLVVDASGRGSQAAAWLKALGHMPPPVDQVRIDMGYASRLVRREPGQLPGRTYVATIGTPPQCKRSAYLLPVEGDRWLATLCGFFGDHAPTDDAGFLTFAESLPTDDIASVLRQAEPLTPIVTHRLPSDQWRRFEKLKNPPAGFVTIGDGVCSFNPIYGQGMSSAAQQAIALREAVQKHGFASPALPRSFYKAAARIIGNPWQIAAGGDFCYPEATGPRPALIDLLNAYLRKAIMAAHQDPVVAFAIANVQNLLAPPPSLLRPQIALRVWKSRRRSSSLSAGLHTH